MTCKSSIRIKNIYLRCNNNICIFSVLEQFYLEFQAHFNDFWDNTIVTWHFHIVLCSHAREHFTFSWKQKFSWVKLQLFVYGRIKPHLINNFSLCCLITANQSNDLYGGKQKFISGTDIQVGSTRAVVCSFIAFLIVPDLFPHRSEASSCWARYD